MSKWTLNRSKMTLATKSGCFLHGVWLAVIIRRLVVTARPLLNQLASWDEKGIPTSEELKRFGLDDVDEVLEKLRK